MSDHKRGKRSGNRGNDFRPSELSRSRTDWKGPNGTSITALIADDAVYFAYAEVEENEVDHIVPRHSITRRQFLGLKPQQVETVDLRSRQLDKRSGNLVETTDQRIVWRSDRNLLRTGKPFDPPKGYERVTAHTKRRVFVPEPTKEDTQIVPGAKLGAHKPDDAKIDDDLSVDIPL